MTQWTLVNIHRGPTLTILLLHNQSTQLSPPHDNNSKNWMIRPNHNMRHTCGNCTYRPPTPFDCYPTLWHFHLLLFFCCGYGNIPFSPQAQHDCSSICSVHLTNQYTRRWSICPTHTHAPNHKNTSPLLSPSHIHWHTMHKFLVTNKGLLLHN